MTKLFLCIYPLLLFHRCVAEGLVCGDSICTNEEENCSSCPIDCGSCDSYIQSTIESDDYCMDDVCSPDENCTICPEDCGDCGFNSSIIISNNTSINTTTVYISSMMRGTDRVVSSFVESGEGLGIIIGFSFISIIGLMIAVLVMLKKRQSKNGGVKKEEYVENILTTVDVVVDDTIQIKDEKGEKPVISVFKNPYRDLMDDGGYRPKSIRRESETYTSFNPQTTFRQKRKLSIEPTSLETEPGTDATTNEKVVAPINPICTNPIMNLKKSGYNEPANMIMFKATAIRRLRAAQRQK